MGGLDQATLKTDDEWRGLGKLDPKLWMALSCPIQGLEFSQETLAILDSDHDGRIRINEVLEAVDWVCKRFEHPANLREGGEELKAGDMRKDTEEGKSLALALRLVLAKKAENSKDSANLAQIEEVLSEAAGYPFNGDGIVPPDSALESGAGPDTKKFIETALAIAGGRRDASGKPGLDAAIAGEFVGRLSAMRDWRQEVKNADLPLGDHTGQAWTLLASLGTKIDDYFYRCGLAAFAPNAIERLNEIMVPDQARGENDNPPLPGGFNMEMLKAMPLARVGEKAVLEFGEGINPAWKEECRELVELLAPMLQKSGDKFYLDEKAWKGVKQKFSAYAAILEKKPQYPAPDPDAAQANFPGCPTLCLAPANDPLGRDFLPPDANGALAALSDAEITSLLEPETGRAFTSLVEKDLAAPPLTAIQDLRKASLFQANLYTFLMNFLSFLDFYDPRKKAIFQAGTLYLDSRACCLCVPVADVDTHTRLSDQSHLCLIYCACRRLDADGSEKTATIAAALTQGNLASLIEGRHGVFIDNAGLEWDTRIIRIVHNPISIREAVWAPYIRLGNMANEQIQKFVSAKDSAISKMTGQAASGILPGGKTPQPAERKEGFDFAKGAGIFAAVSVALSVLSAAFAYIANSLASLGWWWPLALLMVFICISGPSAIMAWFKLRRRSLGPLLDASGWAVNQGAPINLLMGSSLTSLGKLPPYASRDYNDPYGISALVKARKRRNRILLALLLILLLACAACAAWLYFVGEPAWLLKLRIAAGV